MQNGPPFRHASAPPSPRPPRPPPPTVAETVQALRSHAGDLITIAADILKARTWGEPIKRVIDADKHDDQLCLLAMRCRYLADKIGATSRDLKTEPEATP